MKSLHREGGALLVDGCGVERDAFFFVARAHRVAAIGTVGAADVGEINRYIKANRPPEMPARESLRLSSHRFQVACRRWRQKRGEIFRSTILASERAFNISELEAENRRLQSQAVDSPLDGIVAASEGMLAVCRVIEKVAPMDVTTLLLGESGTGKELLARALHRLSPRVDKRFVAINCAAIPENLLESELFGFEKGAFTGAAKQTLGKIELADGGTLFLDEIADMPLALQAKMLRFLQERVIERIGGREEIPVDVRVVSATNQNPVEMIEQSTFREDLYYRVSEITIDIPPFRDREEGRLILARTLLARFCEQQGRALSFTDDANDAIEAYLWPGNVRELENKIKGAVIMGDGNQITARDLGLEDSEPGPETLNLREVRRLAESKAIRVALMKAFGKITRAAEMLGVTRPTLYDLMNKYGLSAEGYSKRANDGNGAGEDASKD